MINAPGWARTTNLSVNSRTRQPIAPRRQIFLYPEKGFLFSLVGLWTIVMLIHKGSMALGWTNAKFRHGEGLIWEGFNNSLFIYDWELKIIPVCLASGRQSIIFWISNIFAASSALLWFHVVLCGMLRNMLRGGNGSICMCHFHYGFNLCWWETVRVRAFWWMYGKHCCDYARSYSDATVDHTFHTGHVERQFAINLNSI